MWSTKTSAHLTLPEKRDDDGNEDELHAAQPKSEDYYEDAGYRYSLPVAARLAAQVKESKKAQKRRQAAELAKAKERLFGFK